MEESGCQADLCMLPDIPLTETNSVTVHPAHPGSPVDYNRVLRIHRTCLASNHYVEVR